MSAIGPRRERGGLRARCLPSLPAPCFGDTALGLGDGDQRIMWVLIQPATRTDVTCWLPQVTLWRKKIKSRCLVKGITKQEATSCCREHLFFVSTALWLPLQWYLDFLSKMYPASVPFFSHCMWVGLTTLPIPVWALIGSGQAAYLISPGTGLRERFSGLVGTRRRLSPFSLRRGMRVWGWKWLEWFCYSKMRNCRCWGGLCEHSENEASATRSKAERRKARSWVTSSGPLDQVWPGINLTLDSLVT